MKSALVVFLAVTTCCLAAPELWPSSFDWRPRGVVSPVQNRSRDDPCGRITVLDTIESMHAIYGGSLLNLSFAQVSDCLGKGLIANSFGFIAFAGGLCSEQSYSTRRDECKPEPCVVAKVLGQQKVPSENEQLMLQAVLQNPIMALVDGRQPSFQSYSGGIYEDSLCAHDFVTQALLVVGFGEEEGNRFWICKNNWGSDWGENGYIRILKGVNMCGIELDPSFAF